MKKLLFTAMVVLAFSGASFAKTGEVDAKVVPVQEKVADAILTPCDDLYRAVYIYLITTTPSSAGTVATKQTDVIVAFLGC